ncbi:hypothetical protein YB2330_000621 [Saitoella coloradoensis]
MPEHISRRQTAAVLVIVRSPGIGIKYWHEESKELRRFQIRFFDEATFHAVRVELEKHTGRSSRDATAKETFNASQHPASGLFAGTGTVDPVGRPVHKPVTAYQPSAPSHDFGQQAPLTWHANTLMPTAGLTHNMSPPHTSSTYRPLTHYSTRPVSGTSDISFGTRSDVTLMSARTAAQIPTQQTYPSMAAPVMLPPSRVSVTEQQRQSYQGHARPTDIPTRTAAHQSLPPQSAPQTSYPFVQKGGRHALSVETTSQWNAGDLLKQSRDDLSARTQASIQRTFLPEPVKSDYATAYTQRTEARETDYTSMYSSYARSEARNTGLPSQRPATVSTTDGCKPPGDSSIVPTTPYEMQTIPKKPVEVIDIDKDWDYPRPTVKKKSTENVHTSGQSTTMTSVTRESLAAPRTSIPNSYDARAHVAPGSPLIRPSASDPVAVPSHRSEAVPVRVKDYVQTRMSNQVALRIPPMQVTKPIESTQTNDTAATVRPRPEPLQMIPSQTKSTQPPANLSSSTMNAAAGRNETDLGLTATSATNSRKRKVSDRDLDSFASSLATIQPSQEDGRTTEEMIADSLKHEGFPKLVETVAKCLREKGLLPGQSLHT